MAAMENGGLPMACNDQHFGQVANMLAPGKARDMGDGWETRRRREPGHDWSIIAPGTAQPDRRNPGRYQSFQRPIIPTAALSKGRTRPD